EGLLIDQQLDPPNDFVSEFTSIYFFHAGTMAEKKRCVPLNMWELFRLLAGGGIDYFDFRAVSGSAGGWGNLVFEFQLAPGVVAIQPANIFSSGCVLQRGQTVPVWGICTPEDTITLAIDGQSKVAVADENGHWRIELDPEVAGGPFTMSISGSNSLAAVLANVYFGDVWILAGQSNMFQPLGSQVANFPDDYPAVPDASDDFDDVRFAIVDTVSASNAPADDVVMAQPWGRWQADQLADMSAVGYFFTRFLNEKLDANGMGNVPLGVIKVCKGGTSIEEWISAEELDAVKTEDGSMIITADASGYYNGMIAPIQDYAIKGALWYQGEGNAASIARISQYPRLKEALVGSWRTQWNNPDMPFYYVQLAPYYGFSPIPSDELWAWMRESQTACLAITNTGMACIIDGGLQGNIHPPFKDRAGERLARMALSDTYGISTVSRGPILADCQFSGAEAVITLDHVAGGLRTQAVDSQPDAEEIAAGFPAVSVSSNELAGFALCGSDQIFYWATAAEIIGSNQVRVSSTDVPEPVAVRYAWQNYPRCNLFSSEGLPAEPFRTDAYGYLTSSGAMHTVPTSTVVYRDDFSGTAGPASGTVPEVSLAGFQDISVISGLDGAGHLESTDPSNPGANYRFQIANDPLTADSSIGEIKYTVVMRTPTNDWVMVGFHEFSTNGLLTTAANTGPVVQFSSAGLVILRGGTYPAGNNSAAFRNNYTNAEVITAEMTYHVGNQTMDLAINGSTVTNGFALGHEFPIGTPSDPVVHWAQIQLRFQPTTANGGAYIDSFQIETSPTGLGTTVYQDDFSGEVGIATTTVPEISPVGFEQKYFTTGLDGSGHLESTDPGQPTAGYRVKLGADPLTADSSIAAIQLTIQLRVPTNDWVMVGFQEADINGLLAEDRNAGPIIQFNPSSIQLRGGTWGGGNISATLLNRYVPGQVVTAEMTYHLKSRTMDLSINGLVVIEGFALDHEYPVGTSSDPVVYWLNTQLRLQPAAADGGAYIDSFQVRTFAAEVPGSGYAVWATGWGAVDIGSGTNDYDGDGLLNVYEYGLGGDPTSAVDQGMSPVFGVGNVGGTNYFGYIHPQLADPNSGLAYFLELNTNLVLGVWTNAGYVVTGTNVTGGTLDFVTNVVDTGDGRKYIRLIIE
ncbi:MAG: sialate O-acetylesterase, partial [Kiritimatiellales bacterium]|nr:sialate O-acetylesterase [Kiritimatiellales bacterium]